MKNPLHSPLMANSLKIKQRTALCFFWAMTLVLGYSLRANHIVGGFISMKQLDREKGEFLATFVIYMDETFIQADEESLYNNGNDILGVFRKSDNATMILKSTKGSFLYPPNSYNKVIYENRACADQRKLNIRRYVTEAKFTLKPEDYQDPQGYFIAFGSCCRNQILSNTVFPNFYGSVIVTEFPALYQEGKAIVFNTPVFSELNGDYICTNRLFKYDMSATDPDGDELRYRMTTPLSTGKRDIFDVEFPFQKMIWANGSSDQAQIPGNPGLSINPKTGELSVKASTLGLFVFGITCDKYRNGIKIASVYHEFQLPVVDCFFRVPPPPQISYLNKTATELLKCQDDSLSISTEGGPEYAFQWQLNGNNIRGANAASLQIKSAGEYTVVKSYKAICSDDTTSKPLKVKDSTLRAGIKLSVDKAVLCEGETSTLLATSSQSNEFNWWKDGKFLNAAPNPLPVKLEGNYTVQAKASATLCASLLDSVKIKVIALPDLIPAFSQIICFGDSASLSTKAQAGVNYLWNLGNKTMGNQASITVRDTGRYFVTVSRISTENNLVCKVKSDPYQVGYKPECLPSSFQLYIPDIFTPNNDNQNDSWVISNIKANPDCKVSIYNRWGEIIYYSDGYANPWDGTVNGNKVETGAYVYQIYLPKINHTYRGKVVVVY
jgi:gliding motility-associated-like protein